MHKYKQVIVLRTDIGEKKKKKVAQGCHAAIIAYERAQKLTPNIVDRWKNEGQRKIALKIRGEEELLQIYNQATDQWFPASLITDAGLTQLEPGTKTAVGIGPALAKDIDRITGKLKLL